MVAFKSSKFKFALLASAFIHTLAFLSVYLFKKNVNPPGEVQPKYSFEVIEKGMGKTEKLNSPTKAKHSSPRSYLKFHNTFHSENKSQAQSKGSNEEFGQGWSSEDFGSGGMKFGNIEEHGSLERIAQEVDGLLFFPGPLRLREMSGGVNVKLFFKSNGGCDNNRMKIDSGSIYFRVYVLALIKKLCKLPQIERLKLVRNDRVDLNFNFLLVEQSQYQEFPPYKITGNMALFQRHEVKNPLELRLGPIRLYGPYVAVDFAYLFEKWDQLTTGRDPLEDFR